MIAKIGRGFVYLVAFFGFCVFSTIAVHLLAVDLATFFGAL